MIEEEESHLLYQTSCDECGSSDANSVYSDGHSYCFSCGHRTAGDGNKQQRRSSKLSKNKDFIDGEYKDLKKREITEATCRKFGYKVGNYKGQTCQIAPFYNKDGELIAQNIRLPDKKFPWIGDVKSVKGLFGQHIWKPGGKKIVVTEGFVDCLSVSQLQNNKWPVVSIKNGADGARKDFEQSIDFLESFEQVIICFDNDEPGKKAAAEVAALLSPGKAHIMSFDLKDASEMLMAGRGKEVISALWDAKPYRPDGIVQLKDIEEDVSRPIEEGLSWWDDRLTSLTYGRRFGELYCIGAGTGIGKTDWLIQQINHDLLLDQQVGVFFFEQQPTETIKRLAAKRTGKKFYLPQEAGGWTDADLKEALKTLDPDGNLFLYDHFGCTDWEVIKPQIRYLAKCNKVKIFYIDHLTALAAGSDLNEKDALEQIMAELGGMVKELDIMVHLVSHLTTPDGSPHEEGGRVAIRHFKGSRSIGFWCHAMFGIERNPQSEDEKWRRLSTFRVLKDRLSGEATGQTLLFSLDNDTCQLIPMDDPTDELDPDEMFEDNF